MMAYCTNCGKETQSRICDSCGERNKRVHKYCYWCGKPFLGKTSKCLECGERVRISLWGILKCLLFLPWLFICSLLVYALVVLDLYALALLMALSALVFFPVWGHWIRKVTFGRKHKFWIRWAANVMRLFLGVGLFVYVIGVLSINQFCEHEWVVENCDEPVYCALCGETEDNPREHIWMEATCEAPRHCVVCGITEGKTMRHSWEKATCTVPKSCRYCDATEGEPLGHKVGETTQNRSVPKGVMIVERKCSVCNARVQYREDPITSFVENNRFQFSPGSFMNRMQTIAKKKGYDFQYSFTERSGALQADYTCKAAGEERQGYLLFFKDTNVLIPESERWEDGVWCVNMVADGPADQVGDNITEQLLQLLYMSCDPTLGSAESRTFKNKKLETTIKAIKKGELAGYYERNGLLYEFMLYQVQEKQVSVDSVQVYPKDWRKK